MIKKVSKSPEINIDVNIESENWEANPCLGKIDDICSKTLEITGFSRYSSYIEISILLTDDDHIKKLNRDYRHKDKATNVLSFPSEEFEAGNYNAIDEHVVLGDIVLAFGVINIEAEEQGKKFYDHFCHLLVHGLLHLMGYDHEEDDEAEVMEEMEVRILGELGVSSPY